MTKHRAVVSGYDPTYENPDTSIGRPKGVQTVADMRVSVTYDVLAEGIFALHGTPTLILSPTDTLQIGPSFMAAIESEEGGFYTPKISANESVQMSFATSGLAKLYIQQKDWQHDATSEDSEVVLGFVYGGDPIPDNAIALFTTTITAETSTNALTFTPVYKWTGAASGVIRVPAEADLDDIVLQQVGLRALAIDEAGEFFYGSDDIWHETTIASPKVEELITSGWIPTLETWTYTSFNATTLIGVVGAPAGANSRYSAGQRIKFFQATGGTKIGTIISITSTSITFKLQSVYTLVNQAISSPFWSAGSSPKDSGFISSAQLGDSGWITFPYASGFSGLGGSNPAYRKIGNRVYLRGLVAKGSNVGSGDTLGNLPAGFRPANDYNQWVGTLAGSAAATAKVTVSTTGSISCAAVPTASTSYLGVDPITYLVD